MEKSDEKSVKVVGYWVSAYVHRVRWALKLKGIDYEYVEEDLFNRTPLLSHLNPVHGKVPVLVHEGNPLPESAVILEYIDEVWTQHPLLPLDAYERAQARFWSKFVDQKIITAAALALYLEGEDQERAVKLAVENLEKIEEELKGKSYLGGERLGYMDLIFGFVAYMLPVWEEVASVKILDPVRFPAIAAWTDNFLDHPVIRAEYLPSRDEMITFYVARRKEAALVMASDIGKRMWSVLLSFWVSGYVHRVRWALKLKGVDYEYIEEDIFNKTPLLSHLNTVHGKVPVLLHHGNPLPESAVILEYIEDVWTHHPLLPRDAHERAQVRFWARFVDQKVAASIVLALYSEGEDQERAVKLAVEYLEKIEEMIRGKSFFGGESLGYMDLMIGFVAYLLPVWEEVASVKILDPVRFPAIAAWTGSFLQHPAIKAEYLPAKDEIFSFYEHHRREFSPLCASHSDIGKKMWSNLLS